jgi:hypothetical protein
VNESLAKNDFKELDIKTIGAADTSLIRDRMQKGYFKIGDDKNRKIQSETTYATGISASKDITSLIRDMNDRKHLQGSINLGTNSTEYMSEAKSK